MSTDLTEKYGSPQADRTPNSENVFSCVMPVVGAIGGQQAALMVKVPVDRKLGLSVSKPSALPVMV